MKKRLIAAAVAVLLLISCVPFLSGCKAGVNYTLNEDKQSYTIAVKGFSGSFGGEFTVPEYYGEGENRFKVTAIAAQGFASTNLTKITIPSTIEKIGVSAFMYCAALKEVVFQDGSNLEGIPNGAFAFCDMLEKINLPQSVKFIYPQAFNDCKALKYINLPSGLEKIGYRAFYNSGLESIVIPENVFDETVPVTDENGEPQKDEQGNIVTTDYMGIGYGAFHSCTNLKYAVIKSEKIKTLYAGVFGYCTALESVYLPASVIKIEGVILRNGSLYYGHAFHHDGALKHVYFAGTEEQWNAIEIDNKEYKDKQVSTPFDNSAVINADKVFGQTYES